jgi:hypothetical protein
MLSLPINANKKMIKKQTGLNPTQLYLLKLFAQNDSEESLNELKGVLMEFYQKKLNERLNALWDGGVITLERLEEIKREHLRIHTGN